MKTARFDLTLSEDEVLEVNDGRVAVAVPKDVQTAYLKLPKKARNKKLREFVLALVKGNVTKT